MYKHLIILISLIFSSFILYGQINATGNKLRLLWQTTGDGLVYRGAGKPTYAPSNPNGVSVYLDTISGLIYTYRYSGSVGSWSEYMRGDRGDIDVDSLTWTVDTNAIVTVDIQNGAITGDKLATGAVDLTATTVTGTLPVSKGGTGSTSYVSNYLLRYDGTKLDTADIRFKFTGGGPKFMLNADSSAYEGGVLNLFERDGYNYIFWYALSGANLFTGRMGLNGDDFIFSNQRADDNANVEFRTRNTGRLIIKGNGDTGIGITDAANITAQLHTTGTVRFQNFGSGTATFDGSGNISSVSDSRAKKQDFTYKVEGLKEIMQLKPIAFKLKSDIESQGEYAETQIGFFADDVKQVIPSASFLGPNGYFNFLDRALIAATVKAIQEQQTIIEQLQQRIIQLENK